MLLVKNINVNKVKIKKDDSCEGRSKLEKSKNRFFS